MAFRARNAELGEVWRASELSHTSAQPLGAQPHLATPLLSHSELVWLSRGGEVWLASELDTHWLPLARFRATELRQRWCVLVSAAALFRAGAYSAPQWSTTAATGLCLHATGLCLGQLHATGLCLQLHACVFFVVACN